MMQYEKIKEQYKDYILLFQVGDFYEIYGEDASEFVMLMNMHNVRCSIVLIVTMNNTTCTQNIINTLQIDEGGAN